MQHVTHVGAGVVICVHVTVDLHHKYNYMFNFIPLKLQLHFIVQSCVA